MPTPNLANYQHRFSLTPGVVPQPAMVAEISVNLADKSGFSKTDSGTIVELFRPRSEIGTYVADYLRITLTPAAAIMAAIAAAATVSGVVTVQARAYDIGTTSIVVPWNVTMHARGANFQYSGNGVALEIVGDTQAHWQEDAGRDHVLPKVERPGSAPRWNDLVNADATSVGVQVTNCTYDNFHVPGIKGFNKGLHLVATTSDTVCNTFRLGKVLNNRYSVITNPHLSTGPGDAIHGCNQNTFIGGALIVNSAYTNVPSTLISLIGAESNGNNFFGVNLERGGNTRAIYCQAQNNSWIGCRFENAVAGYIEYEPTAINNYINGGNSASVSKGELDLIVNDKGYGNVAHWSGAMGCKGFYFDFNVGQFIGKGGVNVPALAGIGDITTGLYFPGGGVVKVTTGGYDCFAFTNGMACAYGPVQLGSGGGYRWGSGSPISGGFSTQISRAANGVVSLDSSSLMVGGTYRTVALSPVALTGTVNNYAPGGVSEFQRWSAIAATTVTGLSLAQVDGQRHTVVNVGANPITLANAAAGSLAANRFLSAAGDLVLAANQAARLIYDATTGAWRMFKEV
jgi:hypothetical protein